MWIRDQVTNKNGGNMFVLCLTSIVPALSGLSITVYVMRNPKIIDMSWLFTLFEVLIGLQHVAQLFGGTLILFNVMMAPYLGDNVWVMTLLALYVVFVLAYLLSMQSLKRLYL